MSLIGNFINFPQNMILVHSKFDSPFAFNRIQNMIFLSVLSFFAGALVLIIGLFFFQKLLVLPRAEGRKAEGITKFKLSYFKPMRRQDYFASDLDALNRSVTLVAVNEHPLKIGPRLLLLIGNESSPLEVELDKRIYLSFHQKEPVISSEVTPLWFKPILSEEGYQTELDFWLPVSKEDRVISSRSVHRIKALEQTKAQRVSWMADPVPEQAIQELRRSQWLGKDCLFSLYGGERYHSLASRERILMSGSELLYLDEGDFVYWDGCAWKTGQVESSVIGQVKRGENGTLMIEVFGKKGFFHYPVNFSVVQAANPKTSVKDEMTNIHSRTSSRVSCRLKQKPVVLDEGDWLLLQDHQWVILKTPEEIEAYLKLRKRGELLVFDRLEKAPGKTTFHGKLFNELRTSWESVSVSMNRKVAKPVNGPRPNHFQPPSTVDADFDDEDDEDDFNDENSDYFRFMNNGQRNDVPPPY